MPRKLDINDVVNGLLDQVAIQAREIAMLKVQLSLVTQEEESEDEPEDD